MTTLRKAVLLALYGATAFTATASLHYAQAQTAAPDSETAKVEGVTVVGSRRANSSTATDTMVPVDTIPMSKSTEQGGQFDLAQSLQYLSPSFNSTRQTGADGADLIDSAALRGLGSDQTLVLVNGKRRHTTSLVNIFGARNRGNTGADLNAIPLMAIENVQILRDGAAAQYGSDAIAGVMDIGLKKRPGCEAALGYGQYSVGDGKNYMGTAYCGFRVGDKGVIGVTGEYQDRGRSNRAEAPSLRTIGDSAVKNPTLYINGDIPTSDISKFYFTLGLQKRDASSGAFERGGVGTDDVPSRNSAAMYPNGFVPFIDAKVQDRYAIIGNRLQLGEWNADLSQTYGFNDMRYNINHTLNASLANQDLLSGGRGISPTAFNAGGFSFTQMTTNADMSRFFPSVMSGMNVAFGAEYRREFYNIGAGEKGSYFDYDGGGEGSPGSQGFPGFQPSDETNQSRRSTAVYADIETDFTKSFKTQAALRYEKYSDFGSNLSGKLAASLKATDALLLRGSASTGFRAPSLQQVYFSSTFTDFPNGIPVDVVIAPSGSALATSAGLPKLKEEKSKSFTLGATFTPSAAIAMTADMYRININDRIVLSGSFEDTDANQLKFPALFTSLKTLGVGQAQFFVNSVNTATKGLDVTFSNNTKFGANKLTSFLALNVSKTEVTDIHTPPALIGSEDVLLSRRERLFIEQGGPRRKATLGFDLTTGALETGLKIIHFGPQTLGSFTGPFNDDGTPSGVPDLVYKAKTSADLSFAYSFDKNTKLTIGGNNIFNVKPTKQDAFETDNGFIYDSVQFGLNGASYFARLWKKF
ncbi:MAG: hypothetical protein RL020_2206 [Pseudomonadota bacterium]|jgi:iron complex outermembrane recepter protein